jgi:CheY-like chemotaxis protein
MTKRILIVDDDELVLIALRELLKPHGYEVHAYTSGSEALNILDDASFDLLIFDVMMPEMDGFELCTRVRNKELHRETPIVFLTAKSREEDRKRGLEVGANLFLSKPISPDKLLKLISDTLG